jgi:hypothetical protein
VVHLAEVLTILDVVIQGAVIRDADVVIIPDAEVHPVVIVDVKHFKQLKYGK